MKIYNVSDEYRINKLSLEPGGSVVTAYYEKYICVYDKVKNPQRYIAAMNLEGINKIELNGKLYYGKN